MPAEPLGIVLGLTAAVLQSGSYIFSRLFVLRGRGAVVDLLIASHVLMGAVSLALLPVVWSSRVPPLGPAVMPLLGTVLFYLIGQAGLFLLMRQAQASRVAPLLGLKIVVLALITTASPGGALRARQWLAVALSAAAALALNSAGNRLSPRAGAWLLVTCVGYSISDLGIAALVRALAPLPRLHASVVGVCLSYALCGLSAAAALPFLRARNPLAKWRDALPFSAFWFAGMCFLFACFAAVGPVFGNILQSTRGFISIVAGALLARMGLAAIEETISRRVLAWRLAAGALMTAAIWLFSA